LNIRDIESSVIAMKTLDGLVFYNSGSVAGAS